MPTKIVGRNASLYIHDSAGTCRPLSALASNITLSWTADAIEVTGFGEDNRQRVSNTIKDWELTFDGFYSPASNETDAVLGAILGGSTFVQFGSGGSTSGCPKYSACGILTSYEMTNTTDGAATVSATFVARTGSMTKSTWA